eukprot:15378891-Alexandrium_andersonii.AAC.1
MSQAAMPRPRNWLHALSLSYRPHPHAYLSGRKESHLLSPASQVQSDVEGDRVNTAEEDDQRPEVVGGK